MFVISMECLKTAFNIIQSIPHVQEQAANVFPSLVI